MLSQVQETREELKQVFKLPTSVHGIGPMGDGPGVFLEGTFPETNYLRCSEAEFVLFCFKPQSDTWTTSQGQTSHSLIDR